MKTQIGRKNSKILFENILLSFKLQDSENLSNLFPIQSASKIFPDIDGAQKMDKLLVSSLTVG